MSRQIVIQIPTFKEACTGIKNHIVEHKEFYIGFGVGVLLTSAAVLANETCNEIEFGDEENSDANAEISQRVLAFKTGDVTQNVHIEQTVIRRGHPGFLVRCDQTGETFASYKRAGEMLGVDRTLISKQINGEIPNVKGYTFTNLGEAQPVFNTL